MSQPNSQEVTEQDPTYRDRRDLVELVDYEIDELRTYDFLSGEPRTRELLKPSGVLKYRTTFLFAGAKEESA